MVSQLSKLLIELDDKHHTRGARLERQMECLVDISQDRVTSERENFDFEKQKFAEQHANLST